MPQLTTVMTILVATLINYGPMGGEGSSCEECNTVQRYINASGYNYVTFEPCLSDKSCPNYCWGEYEIIEVTSMDREAIPHWNKKQVLLVVYKCCFIQSFC